MARQKPQTTKRLRTLRHLPTDVEKKLWRELRAHRLQGHHFRRQYPIGPYMADFVCVKARLVVELDGSQHAENPRDTRRDAHMTAAGWTVLRFWNNLVNESLEGVLLEILNHLPSGNPPPPQPSPASPHSAREGATRSHS